MKGESIMDLTIEITQECYNQCIFCSSNGEPTAKQALSAEDFEKIIDECDSLGVKTIYISGGEPLAHPQVFRMLKYAKGHCDAKIVLYTSGIWNMRTDERKGSYCSLCKYIAVRLQEYVDVIVFDVPSVIEVLYDSMMGTKGRLLDLRTAILSTRYFGTMSEINFVATDINTPNLGGVIRFASNLGIKQVNILRYVHQGRGLEYDELKLTDGTIRNLKLLLERAKDNYPDVSIRCGIPLMDDEGKHLCNAGISKMVIRYDGMVYPCEAFKWLTEYEEFVTSPDPSNEGHLIGSFVKHKPMNIKDYPLSKILETSRFIKALVNYCDKYKGDSVF